MHERSVTGGVDLEREGLLEGCSPEDRADRERLVAFLLERGVGVPAMRRAIAEDRLPMLASERALAGDSCYSVDDLAEAGGVPPDVLLEMRHAMGLRRPDRHERGFGEADLEWAWIVGRLLDAGLERAQLVETMRVLGRGLAQSARSMRETLAAAIVKTGVSEHQLALSSAQAAEELLPLTGPLMQHTLRAHLLEQVLYEQNTTAALRQSGRLPATREVAVCFADLVGFTGLGERLPIDEVEQVASELERLAADVIEPPVQLVKTIGDAVMLVAPAPAPLLETSLALVERTAAHDDMPALRVGVGYGTATNRGGDWYGPPVNLASRVTAAAPPDAVVCTEAVREATGDHYRWTSLGAHRLKGIDGEVALVRVDRGGARSR